MPASDAVITYRSPYPDLTVQPTTLPEHILSAAATHAGTEAPVDAPTGRRLSYAELSAGITALAAGLAERGLVPGDTFALHAPNRPEWALAYLGAMAAGAAVTTSSTLATGEELTRQLRQTHARFVLTVPALFPLVRGAAETAGCQELFPFGEGERTTPLSAVLAPEHQTGPVAVQPGSVAALPFSSGTTGLPKPVGLTHRGLVWNISQIGSVYPVGPASRVLLFVPMCHSLGQVLMGVTLSTGGSVVTLPQFD